MPPAQHDPDPIAGALICNLEGCLFLMQSHRWGDRYVVPGGYAEVGETLEAVLDR